MNVLMGYAGQVSLGHAAFYGIGAFISGVVVSEWLGTIEEVDVLAPEAAGVGFTGTVDQIWRFAAGIGMAGIMGAIVAVILGLIALRLRGLYLALVTIAYGALAELTLFKLGVFHGGAGVVAPRPDVFEGDIVYSYVVFILLAVALYIDWRLTGSKAGRAIQALRDDERVAASWGINVTSYKLLAFVISGILAGVAGGLFGHLIGAVSSEEFTFTVSLTFVLMTVVGGLGNRWGVVQGGILFAILPTLLDRSHEAWHFWPFDAITALWEPLIGAALLVLTLIFFPGGIAQQQEHLQRWLSFKRFKSHDVHVTAAAVEGSTSARP
jgi:branched-chain amino acid transport system permease protein